MSRVLNVQKWTMKASRFSENRYGMIKEQEAGMLTEDGVCNRICPAIDKHGFAHWLVADVHGSSNNGELVRRRSFEKDGARFRGSSGSSGW